MKNKNFNKISIPLIIVALVFVVYLLGQYIVINSTNLYALEAGSVQEAQQLLKDKDLTKEDSFETIDFYGNYIPNTSFIITKDGQTYYDQGYYMVYKGNYKRVYCINPMKTAWSVTNLDTLNEINNHEYSRLSSYQQTRVSQLILATEALYNKTNDPQYLVAGQLLIWEAVGSDLNNYSSNLEDNMNDINAQADSIDLDNLPKGSTKGEDFQYYDTNGQDLIGTPTEPEIVEPKPDPVYGISVDKTSDYEGQLVEDGDIVTYTLQVTNTSDSTANIFIKDELTDPNFIVDDSQALLINGETSEYTIGDLRAGFTLEGVAPGDSFIITYTVIIEKIEVYNGESIVNSVEACAEDVCDGDISTIDRLKDTKVEIQKAITDANGDGAVEAGEALTFTINVMNSGETVENVVITDKLNDPNINYTLENPVYIDGTDSGKTVKDLQDPGIMVENVQPGQMVEVTFEATAADELNTTSTGGYVTNIATVCLEDEICEDGTGTIPSEGFNVQKTVEDANANSVAEPGEVLTYKINITNEGSEAADFTVTDTIEDRYLNVDKTQALSITPSKTTEPANATIGDLENGVKITGINAGETVVVEYSVTVLNELAQYGEDITYNHISNSVEVCNGEDCEDDSSVITIDPNKPIIDNGDSSILKSITDANGNAIAEPGEVLTFNILITNGNKDEKTFVVKDLLQDTNIVYNESETLSAVTGSEGEFVNPTSPTIGDLKTGIEIKVAADSHFEFTYTGTVADPLVDQTMTDAYNNIEACNEAGECTDGGGIIDLITVEDFDVLKTNYDFDGNNIAEPGDTIHYDITITNTGNSTGNITLVDTFPNYNIELDDALTTPLTIEPASNVTPANPTVADLQTGITISDIQSGQTVVVSFEVKVSDPLIQLNENTNHITNIATICYETTDSEVCEDSTSSITTDPEDPTIEPGDGIGVIKEMIDEDGDGILTAGEKVTFNVKLANDSISEQTIKVIDPLADVNFVYDDAEEIVIVEGNGQLVGSTKVGDFPTGIDVLVPANSSTTLQYHATVANPIQDISAVYAINTVEACNEDGDCTDGGDLLPLESNSSLEVNKKSYVNGIESNEAVNGDAIHYEITVTNTGNSDLENVVIKDMADDGLLTASQPLVITSSSGAPVQTIPAAPTTDDLFGAGITIVSIPRTESVIIEYDTTLILTEQTDENIHFTNIATACVEDGMCNEGPNTITVDPVYPNNPDIGLIKSITDESGDGIAQKGENLTFNVHITNKGLTEAKVTLQDNLDDVNVDYDLTSAITITPDTTQYTPNPATLQNLKDGNLVITIPGGGQGVDLSFTAKVKSDESGFDETQNEITNNIIACPETGDCTDGGGHIQLPATVNFDVQKDVAVNGDYTTSVAEPEDILTYDFKVTNVRNRPLNSFTLTDVMDDDIYLAPAEQDIVITTSLGQTVATQPANPTTTDLYGSGIVVLNDIQPGESFEFSITAQVGLGVNPEENAHLANVITVSTPVPAAEKVLATDVDGVLIASDDAVVTIDETKPVTEGISVVKSITDENGDGEAVEDEKLTFNVKITNSGSELVTLTAQDLLDDPNVAYDLTNTISVTPDTTQYTPKPATLADLQTGIQIQIESGQSVDITYQGVVKNPLEVPENNDIINNFTVCNEDDECTDGGGHIQLPNRAGFDVQKDVAVNGDPTVTEVIDGDVLTYSISVQNNRNTPLENIVVTDIYDDGILVPEQDLIVTSSLGDTPTITPASTTTQLFSDEGITIDALEVGEIVTISYDAQVSFTELSSENAHFTNIAEVCTVNPLTETETKSQAIDGEDGLCASDSAVVTTDPSKPIPPVDGIAVVKNLTDESGDGIAQLGETLTFSVDITNSGTAMEVVTVQDNLDDVNVDYDLTSLITITPTTTVTTPTPATLQDLKDGFKIEILPGQKVNLTFTAKVFDPLNDTNQLQVTNLVNVCDEDENCTDGGGHIPLPGGKSFDVQKDVVEVTDTDGDITDNVVSGSEELKYTITITNTHNRELKDLFIQDTYDDNIIVNTQDLVITSNYDDNPDHLNPNGYTTDDLVDTGFNLALLRVAEVITIEFNAIVEDDLATIENEDLTNFVSVCTKDIAIDASTGEFKNGSILDDDSLCASDSAVVTTDPDDPVDPDGLGVVKTITDENGDGIAQDGEKLDFEIIVTNSSTADKNVTLTDNLDDPNIVYDLAQVLTISPSGTITQNPATGATVGDLQTGSFIVQIPAGTSIVISFSATVASPLNDTTASLVSNRVEACDEDGDCTDGGGHIPLTDRELFTITKDAVTASGTGVVADGDNVKYNITIQNIGNKQLNDILVVDTIDDNLYVNEQVLAIDAANTTQPSFTEANITPNPAYVLKDLMGSGIVIDTLDVGKKVTFTYDGEVKLGLEEDSKDIVNIVTACTESELSSEKGMSPYDPITDELCASDSAKVTTDPGGIANPDVDVLKEIVDESGDGIAQPGENLTFNIYIRNISTTETTYTVKDLLDDPNIVYDLTQALTVLPGSTVTNPTAPTVGDLQTGIDVTVPGDSLVKITFGAKAADPISPEVPYLKNVVEVCEDTTCTDGGGHIPVLPEKGIDVQKDVITTDGTDLVGSGSAFTYEITVTNTGNIKTDVLLKDDFPVELLDIDTTQALDFTPYETDPAAPTVNELLNDGIIIKDLAPLDTITVSFRASVKDPLILNGDEYVGDIDNFATVCTVSKDRTLKDDEDCDTDGGNLTTDPTDPENPEISLRKEIMDLAPEGNEDGIAQPGETITFRFKVVNSDSVQHNYVITDPLADPNVDYDSVLTQTINKTDGSGNFITPAAPTVGDLKTGIEVQLEAGEYIEFEFKASIYDPLVNEFNYDVVNNMEVCIKGTTDCENTTGTIDLPEYERMNVNKSFTTDSVYTDPTTSEDIYYVSGPGEKVYYTIEAQNNGNKVIESFEVKDIIENDFYAYDPTTEILIKDSNNVEFTKPDGSKFTIADLEAGITYDNQLNPGESIFITFEVMTATNIDELLEDGEMIANIANICYDNTFTTVDTTDQTCKNTGTETPYTKDPTIVPPITDDNFTIDKWIEDEDGDDVLIPGEKLTMHIYVVNDSDVIDELGSNGEDLTIKITDSMLDENINYASALTSPVTIVNQTTGEDVTIGTDSEGNVVVSPANPTVGDLDVSKGIDVTLKDGELFELTFEVNASNDIKR